MSTTVKDSPRERARAVYESLLPGIETEENIGKIIVVEPQSGDYEIDDAGISSSRRLKVRRPGADLYAFRIGYKTVESFGGMLERTAP